MIIYLIMNYCVELEFKNRKEVIELYENGQLVAILDDDEQENGRLLKATMMILFERIGSKEHVFVGYVDDIRLSSQKTFVSTMELDYLVTSASIIAEESKNKQTHERTLLCGLLKTGKITKCLTLPREKNWNAGEIILWFVRTRRLSGILRKH